ncbi:hypothetical protein EUGRSUZ_I00876 [Eucalyptus grandis]|uniref:Uncharacterized protein n=2 Tax=Eucalyptus grandis TaxID=71139 RepID=A0ACC3JDJ5_EUCGR|nr:hypothetical protein EUGRSUZ_I00876 [Eucalyptus grandis]
MAAVESGLPKEQQEPSEAPRIVANNNGAENVPKDEPRVSSSECAISMKEQLEQHHQENVPKDEPRVSSSECAISMKEQLEQHHQDDAEGSWAKLSIYRIPDYLKDGDKKAYVPQIVSLGPYHHGKDHLRHMDQHKWRCLCRILERSHHEIGLYIDSLKKVEQRARSCYDGKISMSSGSFVQMMILDGCFVIELLQGVVKGFQKLGYPSNDPVFSEWGSMLKIQIQRDMILLENQIPLFILAQLLGLQPGNPDPEGRVGKLVLKFFDPIGSERVEFDPSHDQCGLHCLEVLWQSFLPKKRAGPKLLRTEGWRQNRDELIPCLTKLVEAGIKFRCGDTEILGDIRFQLDYGILEIPSIKIHQGTRSIFLNLIAFEQSHFNCRERITLYVMFMHNLINSSEDVRYLCKRGIIEHCLGSDAEVADLFNLLCQEVAFDIEDSYLLDYFDNPWSIISFMAAVVLLVLTFLQALYAFYGYYKPRS